MKLAQILERIENARSGEAVKLIAVSKNVTTKEVLELFRQGQTSFGENRVQELKNKSEFKGIKNGFCAASTRTSCYCYKSKKTPPATLHAPAFCHS
mgnify:CR=1 FL=1